MSPVWLAVAYAAGAATTYGVLYVRHFLRVRRSSRRVSDALDGFLRELASGATVRTINLGVVSEGYDDAPPCDDPNCAGCVARKKAAQQEQWSRN